MKEVGCSVRTAENYMRAAELADEVKDETISHLPPATIYKLAAPRLPAAVKSDILLVLEANRNVDPKEINAQLDAGKATRSSKKGKNDGKSKTLTKQHIVDIVTILRDELSENSYRSVCALMIGLEPADFTTFAKAMNKLLEQTNPSTNFQPPSKLDDSRCP